MCPMVGSNSDCGVYPPMQVNSSYSFSSGPKKPWYSVLLLPIHRALTFICSNCIRIAQRENILLNRHEYLPYFHR